METRYAELTGSAAALLGSILDNGLDDVNRRLALEWTAEYSKLMEDPEHRPIAPDDPPTFEDPCPLCAGDHDRISYRDWDGCGEGCGPCPVTS